ncbi:MAG: hypothetical protein A2Y03_10325 [Omnitrophica WOR_2 bacterium GWF2_38_59]|nr:MAG: hypothetical protein A2Y03_10325 [Omnitrophica WOR_2 bacterium GWF2_38_59]OGX46779.1 MAG: hypothetical protein A2243_07365 [Omnitrophica WOR_2 bacterium RIFOXYA2_FULL_38_17]OGX59250.1 MAG: hypothetical protein A2447_06140 [Omnitrophica WOR_2 bacterium RIFOXYC2_FULL_38_12]OGX59259.1 MAG: hypothetical protein A2306_03240 [Omnitrophica WOR_2 bacterium RIFOXYB2_FULL_38_16]HBG61161.1 hypothetical protein [Candidatus Omnitrophota bacterium]
MILIIITIACFSIYMGLLFLLALRTEKGDPFLQRCSTHPIVYAAALGIYCTTWTYYGSVGSAATSGLIFLSLYIGSTLAIFSWPLILRKMVRIKHEYRITSIADFISARYKRSESLAAIVTFIALIGVIPYIALQLRATTTTFGILSSYAMPDAAYDVTHYMAWLIIGIMVLFTILFGARRLDPTEAHKGMMLSVSIQSIVQLLALLCVGIYVTYFIFNGFEDIFSKVEHSEFSKLLSIGGAGSGSYMVWITYLILSMAAVMFLPRQFHVAVVENPNENHIKTALWCFPLYMFLINIFLMPIAMGGLLCGFPIEQADSFVLLLPLANNHFWLALIVFIGGISAAVSMIMISSMTIATMITNHLLLPFINKTNMFVFLKKELLKCRWFFIAALVVVSYVFERFLQASYMLSNIGLISFAAVLQFAPCIIGGLYWHGAKKRGAIMGLVGGFIVWFYTLLLPAMVKSGWLSMSILDNGPFGIIYLKPESLFSISLDNNLVHSVFWSMLVNVVLFSLGSLSLDSTEEDQKCANNFIDIMLQEKSLEVPESFYNDETININQKKEIVIGALQQYFSKADVILMLDLCLDSLNIFNKSAISVLALAELQNNLEKVLTGSLGSAAAHKAVESMGLFTDSESQDLKRVYSEILSNFRLSPQELVNKIDFYREKEELLTNHSRDLEMKIVELNEQIKERKLVEKALSQSENKYKILVEHLPQRIFRKNKEGIYTYCNSIYAKDLNVTREEIIGKTDYDFYPKELADKYRKDDVRIYKNGSAEEFEEQYIQDANETWVHTVKVPIKSEDGTSDGILGIFWDITARRQAAKYLKESKEVLEFSVRERTAELSVANKHLHYKITELEKTKSELESAYKNLKETEQQLFQAEKLASIGQLAAGVAHEINNPIGSVLSNTNVLREYLNTYKKQIKMSRELQKAVEIGNNDEIRMLVASIRQFDEEENLQFIMQDSDTLIGEAQERLNRVEKIVADLSCFSMEDEGVLERVDPNESIKSVLSVLKNDLLHKCDLIEEFGDVPNIKCNQQQIGQVVTHLVMNAVQSLGLWGKVTVKTSQMDGFVLIEVKDDGCGIAKEALIKIFDPFYTTKGIGKGTGLGLSISYEIVKRHKGEMLVESEVGKGTKFTVKLPVENN